MLCKAPEGGRDEELVPDCESAAPLQQSPAVMKVPVELHSVFNSTGALHSRARPLPRKTVAD